MKKTNDKIKKNIIRTSNIQYKILQHTNKQTCIQNFLNKQRRNLKE